MGSQGAREPGGELSLRKSGGGSQGGGKSGGGSQGANFFCRELKSRELEHFPAALNVPLSAPQAEIFLMYFSLVKVKEYF